MRFNLNLSRKPLLTFLAIALLAAILVGLIVVLIVVFSSNSSSKGHFPKGAIVSNGNLCSPIGQRIMDDGGSAVDVAIAVLFCEGVMLPQSMGIGGGFLATIYCKKEKKVYTLNARETAPLSSTEDMFVNKSDAITGAPSAAVPGEILGYWEMHQKFGRLDWKVLIEPSINLARNGFPVSSHMRMAMQSSQKRIMEEPTIQEFLINPLTNKTWEEGDIITNKKLADTLQIIADKKAEVFYNGELGQRFTDDVKKLGGYITMEDLRAYKVKWDEPTTAEIRGNYTVYSSPVPGSGAVLTLILNIMNNLLTTNEDLLWHRLVESFKHAYGYRTQLGDLDFTPEAKAVYEKMINPEVAREIADMKVFDNTTFDDYEYYGGNYSNPKDSGTANMAILHPSGDAVTVTSTVNTYFGSKVRSPSTGIILNDEMDDFSTPGKENGFGLPPSPANFIKPGKRPLSSMCPSIVLDKNGDVVLLVGAAGGSKITTSVAQVILRYLFLKQHLPIAVQAKRLHHQLAPMVVEHEFGFDDKIVKSLEKRKHSIKSGKPEKGFAALTAIGALSMQPNPVFDNRRGGSVAIIEPKNKMIH